MAPVVVPRTALQSLSTHVVDGVHVVRDTGAAWLDGSEAELHERMGGDLPLDSMSDELFATATTWPERYHLSPSRANVLRALDLPADAVVLEVGAGCGAITRYLGEVCARVDALEPTFARARVAARRTADLPGVTVLHAEVSDVPAVPTYDLVVVVGVLEYVGDGAAEDAPYVDFLEHLRATLRPGGQLVLAIENELGVKYLAGAPEDHSGTVFHSVEGYPQGAAARTFSRRRLLGLMRDAGFSGSRVLGAFPDYKLARIVLDDSLFDAAPSLAVQVPSFPSPDWVVPRPVLADEGLLWRELVSAGTGADFVNSFVVIAANGTPTSRVWAPGQLARYFSMHRRRPFQVVKTVEARSEGVTITSRRLGSGSADGLTVLPYSERWEEGEALPDRLLRDPKSLEAEVGVWVGLLRSRTAESTEGTPFDVLPHNLHYVGDVARIIDDEWRSEALSPRDTVLRAALLLTRDLLAETPLDVWSVESPVALVQRIAAIAGEDVTPDDVDGAIAQEARLQSVVGGPSADAEAREATRSRVLTELRHQILAPRYGARPTSAWLGQVTAQQEAIEARDLLFATGAQLDEARRQLDDVHRELDAARADAARLRNHPVRVVRASVRRQLHRARSLVGR